MFVGYPSSVDYPRSALAIQGVRTMSAALATQGECVGYPRSALATQGVWIMSVALATQGVRWLPKECVGYPKSEGYRRATGNSIGT